MYLDALSESEGCLQGNVEAACSVFDSALELEKIKEDVRALAVLYVQYARFLDQVCSFPRFVVKSEFQAHPGEVIITREMLRNLV